MDPLLPDLSTRLADELAGMLGRLAEPCRSDLLSLLASSARPGTTGLRADLAAWLSDEAAAKTVKRYHLLRKLIALAVQAYAQETP